MTTFFKSFQLMSMPKTAKIAEIVFMKLLFLQSSLNEPVTVYKMFLMSLRFSFSEI